MGTFTNWEMTIIYKQFLKKWAKRNGHRYEENDTLNFKVTMSNGKNIKRVIPHGTKAHWEYNGRRYQNLAFLMNEVVNDQNQKGKDNA